MLTLFVIFTLFGIGLNQQNACISQFQTCFKDSIAKHQANSLKGSQLETGVNKCFTDFKCQKPQVNETHTIPNKLFNQTQRMGCERKVIKQFLEPCFANHTGQDFVNKSHENGGKPFAGNRVCMFRNFESACKGFESEIEDVKECVDDLCTSAAPPLCEIRRNCTKALSTECKQEMENAKKEVCKCTRESLKRSKAEIQSTMDTCMQLPKLGRRPNSFFFFTKMADMMCEPDEDENCEKNLKTFVSPFGHE